MTRAEELAAYRRTVAALNLQVRMANLRADHPGRFRPVGIIQSPATRRALAGTLPAKELKS